jgi:hypothetical protein
MFRNIKVFSIIYQQISLNKNHTYFFSTKKNLYGNINFTKKFLKLKMAQVKMK